MLIISLNPFLFCPSLGNLLRSLIFETAGNPIYNLSSNSAFSVSQNFWFCFHFILGIFHFLTYYVDNPLIIQMCVFQSPCVSILSVVSLTFDFCFYHIVYFIIVFYYIKFSYTFKELLYVLKYVLLYFFLYSFIHMCIHCLSHFSPLPPAPLSPPPPPSLPGRICSALFSNFVED
jgi:hypothetical protein